MSNFTIVILISGNGSNLQAIIDSHLNIDIACVISDNPNAYGIERAKKANIKTDIIDYKKLNDKKTFNNTLQKKIEKINPDLIVLAGYMKILSEEFVERFPNKIINIHPSLLPKYPGLNTHKNVLAAGDTFHGVSIHFVNKVLDGGPIIASSSFAIEADDTIETLKEKCHVIEHQMYPEVIKWFAEKRIAIENSHVLLDNEILQPCGYPFIFVSEPYYG